MRLMQKTLGAVAALALSVSLLAGCSSTAGSAAASSSARRKHCGFCRLRSRFFGGRR